MGVFKRFRDYLERRLGGHYAATLFCIVVALVCYPLTDGSRVADAVLNFWICCSLGILVLALRPERISPLGGLLLGGGTLLLPIASLLSRHAGWNMETLYLCLLPCSTLFFFYCAWIIVKSIFTENEVTTDMLCGAVISYLLLGIGWTGIYALIMLTDASAFSVIYDPSSEATDETLLYFSFVTLTTLGYGDILPVSEMARTAAFLEAVAGVMFAAIFVAALVGNWKKT